MAWRGPEYEGEFPSLGWGIVEWIESLGLIVPAGRLAGEPLMLRDSQVEAIVRLYRLDPKTGKRVHRRGQLVGPKGTSKSPTGAMLSLAEFDGPVVFDGWDADGEPVGALRHDSKITVVALSEEQTSNLYDWLYSLLAGSDAAEEYGWTVELGRITKRKGGFGVIEPATSSLSSTGGGGSFIVKEETWLWRKSNGMVRVSKMLEAEAAKSGGWTLEVTNPPEIGLETVAEVTQRQALSDSQILVIEQRAELPDSLKAGGVKLKKNEKAVRKCTRSAYGDALVAEGGWMDEDDIYRAIMSEDTTEEEAYRLWLGVPRQGVGALVDADRYDELHDPGRSIADGSLVVVSFDGSLDDDATALTVTTIEAQPHQELVGFWEKPVGSGDFDDWKVPRDEVDEVVHRLFRTHRVMLLVADYASKWESTIDDWVATWGEAKRAQIGVAFGAGLVFPVWWNNNRVDVDRMTRRYDALLAGDGVPWTHNADPRMRKHVLAMTRDEQRGKLRPGKKDDTPDSRTDAGITSIMGVWAALEMLKLVRGGAAPPSGPKSNPNLAGGDDALIEKARNLARLM